MSKTTMLKAIELGVGVIHSLDFERWKAAGKVIYEDSDSVVIIEGVKMVVSDEAFCEEGFKLYLQQRNKA